MFIDFENYVFQVTEINKYIKDIFDEYFYFIKVEGEIIDISRSKNNHIYFSIKDKDSILNVVCWADKSLKFSKLIKEGVKVCCSGSIIIYSKSSKYQLKLENIVQKEEKGEFLLKLQKLKEKLKKEGLFNLSLKKKIPQFPTKIALITSKNGAVIHDMIHRIQDRFPCEVIICNVSTQGEEAVKDIIKYLKILNRDIADVAIIARGGGSDEDLFCFNNEKLMREIIKVKIPIVSAIGHEDNHTLLDLVADLSASTPTAAIELILPVKKDLEDFFDQQRKKILLILSQKILLFEIKMKNFEKINHNIKYKINTLLIKFDLIKSKFYFLIKENLMNINQKISYYERILENHDRKRILNSGYVMVKQNRYTISSMKNLSESENLSIIFHDGEIEVKILNIKKY
jgi:exodeoxyribonuclease VII large subunit